MLVTSPEQTYFQARLKRLLILLAGGVVILLGRLYHLQIYSYENYAALSKKNFLRIEHIPSPRGRILDCKGRALATSRPVTLLYWQGQGTKQWHETHRILLSYLSQQELLKEHQEQDIIKAERLGHRILLAHDISFEKMSMLWERFPNNPHITIETAFKRIYPYKNIACHIIGYLGSAHASASGQMGLEKILEQALKGIPGSLRKTVNSQGRSITQEELQRARKGADKYTTIDLDLQKLAESLFPKEYAGVFLMMNPRTGALNVVISRPSFDPNMFLEAFSHTEWHTLMGTKQPFLNRAFNALYPPASLFKLVTISAALEQGIITPESTVTCHGQVLFGGRPYYCNNRYGHGTITLTQAIARSCNVPFYHIAQKISIDTLADYAHRFGLGLKTDIVLPEKTGLIPSAHWKWSVKKERWWPGETLSAAIGQSFLLVTPLQMARLVGAIGEGYFIQPCILQEEVLAQQQKAKQPLALLPSTREFLKTSMKEVITKGTGSYLQYLRDFEIYGKTGTAQTSALEKRDLGERYREHGWFVAHITYKNYEPFILLILLEHAGSSRVAITLTYQFLAQYCALLHQREKNNS